MIKSSDIVSTVVEVVEEYKKGNINKSVLQLTIQTSINLAEENYKYDFSKDCKCDSRIGETWCCNQCELPVSK